MAQKLDIQETYDLENQTVSEKDTEEVSYIKKRQTAMESKRSWESPKWDIWDENVRSPIYDTQDWKAMVNMPIEQSLIEMRVGLIPQTLAYRIVPDGRPNVDILEPAKYVLDFFVDRENVMKEIRKRDYDKAKYGTGILYSWLWVETKIINDAEWEWGFYNTKYKEKKINIRHIGVKNVPIRKFWADEKALTIEDAMDCVYQEDLSVEDLRMRYLKDWDDKKSIKWFNYVPSVWVSHNEMSDYKSWDSLSDRNVVLRHYYNKLTWKYIILANKTRPIYVGKMTMKHWELPFTVTQEYQRTDSLYGIGIPEKTKSTKPYINNFFKAALDRTWKGSAVMTVGVEADWELRDDPSVTAHWNFTGSWNVIPYEPNRDVTPNIGMIDQMELRNTKNTGLSVDPNFVLQAKTAFQTGVFKEEQNARLKPNNDARNQGIDRTLTLMLANVSQFAPYLYADAVLDKKTDKIKDYNRLTIRVGDKKIDKKKKGKWLEFTDVPGVYDFFDLDDKVLVDWWMCGVRLETPSTTTSLKALEKAEWNELFTTIMNIAQANPEILQKFPLEDMISKLELLYWYDSENLTARTQEKLNRKKIGDLKEWIAMLWSWNILDNKQMQNAWMDQELQEAEGAKWGFKGNQEQQTQSFGASQLV